MAYYEVIEDPRRGVLIHKRYEVGTSKILSVEDGVEVRSYRASTGQVLSHMKDAGGWKRGPGGTFYPGG